MWAYLTLLLAAVSSAAATLLLKHAALGTPLSVGASWLSPRYVYVGSAFAVYGLGFLCYAMALRRLPVSVGYPVMGGMTMLLVGVIDYFLLAQTLPLLRIVGMVLITLGMVLVVT